jgi:hypothetical protein
VNCASRIMKISIYASYPKERFDCASTFNSAS